MIVMIKGIIGTVLDLQANVNELRVTDRLVERTIESYDVTILDASGTVIMFRDIDPQEIQRVDG